MVPIRFWIKRLSVLLAPSGLESGQTLAESILMFAMVVLVGAMAVTAINVTTDGDFLGFLRTLV